VEIRIQGYGATVKELQRRWREAVARGQERLIRHLSALLAVGQRKAVAQVAEEVGVSASTVYRWVAAFAVRSWASLVYGTSPGRPSRLTPGQRERLKALIAGGPLAAGDPSGCWSTLLLQDLIQREFGVLYNIHYLSTLLHNLGFSYQKARFLSDHLDAARRRVWLEQQWPQIVQEARARGALLLLGDEASFAQWGVGRALLHLGGARPAAPRADLWQTQSLQGLRPDRLLQRPPLRSGADGPLQRRDLYGVPGHGAGPDHPAAHPDPGWGALPHQRRRPRLLRSARRAAQRLPIALLCARLQSYRASVEEHEETHDPQSLLSRI